MCAYFLVQNLKARPHFAAMSLACLTCQNLRTDSCRSYSYRSDEEQQQTGSSVGCWSNKKNPQPPAAENTLRTRVAPVPPPGGGSSNNISGSSSIQASESNPRLMRCHAVRRDIFRDWHFEDFPEGNRGLCLT